jgi:hypothetical protein
MLRVPAFASVLPVLVGGGVGLHEGVLDWLLPPRPGFYLCQKMNMSKLRKTGISACTIDFKKESLFFI